ncbi:transposase [Streptomyces sp. NPDC056178]|uniref:transposase n=1 Tax=unclassified Streptomyces TaxID=2593676 RepID=UPI0035D9F335
MSEEFRQSVCGLTSSSKSAADRIIDHLGPSLARQSRQRFCKPTVLIVDGTLVPTRDHQVAEQSKNCRYSTNHQVVIDTDTRLVVAFGRPLPGNRNDCKAWELSGAKAAVGRTTVMADDGYRGTGLVIPHRREKGQTELHPRRVTKKQEGQRRTS